MTMTQQVLECGGRNGHYYCLKFFKANAAYLEISNYLFGTAPVILGDLLVKDGYKAKSVEYTVYTDIEQRDTTLWISVRGEKKNA